MAEPEKLNNDNHMNDIAMQIAALKAEIQELRETKADAADLQYALAHDKEF